MEEAFSFMETATSAIFGKTMKVALFRKRRHWQLFGKTIKWHLKNSNRRKTFLFLKISFKDPFHSGHNN